MLCVQAGIIEEMLEDTFESMDDQEEMEEAAEMEIDRILFEITAGITIDFIPFCPSFYIAMFTTSLSLGSCLLYLNIRVYKVFFEKVSIFVIIVKRKHKDRVFKFLELS